MRHFIIGLGLVLGTLTASQAEKIEHTVARREIQLIDKAMSFADVTKATLEQGFEFNAAMTKGLKALKLRQDPSSTEIQKLESQLSRHLGIVRRTGNQVADYLNWLAAEMGKSDYSDGFNEEHAKRLTAITNGVGNMTRLQKEILANANEIKAGLHH